MEQLKISHITNALKLIAPFEAKVYESRWLNGKENLKHILHRYGVNDKLSQDDKLVAWKALFFHPRGDEKIGIGLYEIKIGPNLYFEAKVLFAASTKICLPRRTGRGTISGSSNEKLGTIK
ncbi:hypothetical protein Tco_0410845 [Tanacetum coccineum]